MFTRIRGLSQADPGGRNEFSDELFFNPKGREAHSLFNNLFPAVFLVLGAKDVTEGEGLSR